MAAPMDVETYCGICWNWIRNGSDEISYLNGEISRMREELEVLERSLQDEYNRRAHNAVLCMRRMYLAEYFDAWRSIRGRSRWFSWTISHA